MAINAKTHTEIQIVILTGSSITFMMPTFSKRNGTTLARCGSSSVVLVAWLLFLRLCFRGRGRGAQRCGCWEILCEDVSASK